VVKALGHMSSAERRKPRFQSDGHSFAGNIKWPDDLFVVDVPEERKPMLKKLALAAAAIALITSTASADYYIV
jgi:hypothetical protein